MYWYEIVRMHSINQDFFYLYDRDGRRIISVDAGMTGYHEFYDTAAKQCRPERDAMPGMETPYQEKYGVTVDGSVLRCRTGVYAVMLIIRAGIGRLSCIRIKMLIGSGKSSSGKDSPK